jgi:hypothetical protein
MLDDERSQPIELMGSKTMRLRETDGIQPKLGNTIAVFNMNVRRLRSFKAIEEEAKARKPQYSRHWSTSGWSIRSPAACINAAERLMS